MSLCTNPSGLTPVGVSILVLPDQVEETTASGIVLHSVSELDREQMKQTEGVVVAISDYAFHDEPKSRCKVGDRILMVAYAGMVQKGKDEKKYRVIRDTDVVAIIE
jgi:co-chaperonin GroES (HSP10)